MGGKTFGEAQRLTNTHFQALLNHCRSTIGHIFPRIEPLRHTDAKVEHGDLDLLCSWSHANDSLFAGSGLNQKYLDIDGKLDTNPKLEFDLRWKDAPAGTILFVKHVATLVKASRLMLASQGFPILCLKVPCSVVGHMQGNKDAFWQIDLAIIHPSTFDFDIRVRSYGFVSAILGAALKRVHPQLKLHRHRPVFEHQPYIQLSAVQLELTSDVKVFYKWLGINNDRWDRGFATNEAVYAWMTDVPVDSPAGVAWRKMVGKLLWENTNKDLALAKKADKPGKKKWVPKKETELDDFLLWLLGTKWAAIPLPYDHTHDPNAARLAKIAKSKTRIDPDTPDAVDAKGMALISLFDKSAEWTARFEEKKAQAWVSSGRGPAPVKKA